MFKRQYKFIKETLDYLNELVENNNKEQIRFSKSGEELNKYKEKIV